MIKSLYAQSQALLIDQQIGRITMLFKQPKVCMDIKLCKLPSSFWITEFRVRVTYPDEKTIMVFGEPAYTPKEAVDSLLKRMGLTTVEEYILKKQCISGGAA